MRKWGSRGLRGTDLNEAPQNWGGRAKRSYDMSRVRQAPPPHFWGASVDQGMQ